MRILVTGAAGNLGSVTVKYLIENGYEVRATDLAMKHELSCPLDLSDLTDYAACVRLVEGMDAVVHLGNIPNARMAPPPIGYRTNMSCNFNIFQAALEAGVERVLFASSIQVYGMEADGELRDNAVPPHFPMDRETPVCPQNWYALSKLAGENALEYYAGQHGLDSVAFRFPMLVHWDMKPAGRVERKAYHNVWRFLTMMEAARLLEHCLRADLPGFRAYFPVYPGTVLGWTPQDVIREFFPDTPLRKPLEKIETLVDISHITRETGWAPTVPMLEASPMVIPQCKPKPTEEKKSAA